MISIILLVVFYLTGVGFNKLNCFKLPTAVFGFIIICGLFQIYVTPFLWFKTDYIYVYCITISFLLICCGLGLYKMLTIPRLNINNKEVKKGKVFYFSLILIIGQIIAVFILQHSDADDSFYISEISTILSTDKLPCFDPSTGNSLFLFQGQYELVGYEVLLSVFCKLFKINAASFCHTVLPVCFIGLHYILMWAICGVISEKRKEEAFLFVVLINLFSGYSVYSRGAFLLFRIWQGKAVMVNIIIPVMIIVFNECMNRSEYTIKDIIFLVVYVYSAFCTTAVGIYIVPLCYAIYTCIYLISERKWVNTIKLCIPMMMALPYVGLKYYLLHAENEIDRLTTQFGNINYLDVMKSVNGSGFLWIGYIVSIIVILLLSDNDNKKKLFVLYPLVCFVTFLNPFLCNFIAHNITGTPVYWRLFWCIQMTYTFVCAFVSVAERWKIIIAYVFMIICLILCGKPIITSTNFTRAYNSEKISETSKNIADVIIAESGDNQRLMVPEEYSYEIRQYTGEIELVWSRYMVDNYKMINKTNIYEKLYNFYQEIYAEKNNSDFEKYLNDNVKEFDIDYIAFYSDTIIDTQLPIVYKDEKLTVYYVGDYKW